VTSPRLRATPVSGIVSTTTKRSLHSSAAAWALCTAVACALPACGGGDKRAKTPDASKPPEASQTPQRETDLRRAGAKAIKLRGSSLAAGDRAVWLTGLYNVYRLDRETGRTVAKIPVPQDPCEASQFAFGALWTATCSPPGLARIDAASNRIARHVRLAIPVATTHRQASLGGGYGAIWLVIDGPGCSACRLARVDPRSLRIAARIPVKSGSAGVHAGYGAIWVTNSAGNTVQKIDPRRNRVARTIAVGRGPRAVTVGAGSVWTLNEIDGSITNFDPDTGEKLATIPAGLVGAGADLTSGDGSVFARATVTLLSRIDPQTNRVVERYGPASGSGEVIIAFGAVWVSSPDTDTVWRLPLADAAQH
jgi:virginiamycin B lyase